MSEKYAFAMQLLPGCEAEYKARHNAIWPELSALLRDAGVSDYSIHLNPDTGVLFAVLWRTHDHGMDALSQTQVMKRWWAYMADLMETRADNAPAITQLRTVFHMP